MQGDFSRFPADSSRSYNRVLMQQGRAQLDSDWNESVEIATRGMRELAAAVIGRFGAPADDAGFGVAARCGLVFSDPGQFVEIRRGEGLGFRGRSQFTVEAWINARAGGQGGAILGEFIDLDYPAGDALEILPDGRIRLVRLVTVNDEELREAERNAIERETAKADVRQASAPGDLRALVLESSMAIAMGEPAHVAVTFDGEMLRIFANGAMAARAMAPFAGINSARVARMGMAPGLDGGATGFDGTILSMRVWREARSARHIARDMDFACESPREGVAAEWRLDEGSGDTIADAAGNGHNGVLGDGDADASPRWNAPSLWLTGGRCYVEGIACENEASRPFTEQPWMISCPDPIPRMTHHASLIYLDVWDRFVPAIGDPGILEPALRGADTTARAMTVWQARVGPAHLLDENFATLLARGKLRARCAPRAGVMLDNRLYRVEIHDRSGTGTFKWSRENGSVAFAVTAAAGSSLTIVDPGEADLRLRAGDWVELTDDGVALSQSPGVMRQVTSLDPGDNGGMEVTLGNPLPADYEFRPELRPLVRRWETNRWSQDGLTTIRAGQWLELERGIQIRFEADGPYAPGDYWSMAARTAMGSIEWPSCGGAPAAIAPHGIRHFYAPLAMAHARDGRVHIRDLRRIFEPLGGE